MLDDEEFSGLVPSTEHYQPQFSRCSHRKVIELDISALDFSAGKTITAHSSTTIKDSLDKPTLTQPLESEGLTDFATVSQDHSFQESLSDDKRSDANGELHLSTDHYAPSLTSGLGRHTTQLSSVDLNVPEVVRVTKEGACTELTASNVEQEITTSKNTEMPFLTDDLIGSIQESTNQDPSVQQQVKAVTKELHGSPIQASKTEEKTTSPVESKSAEDKTIDRIEKTSAREITTESVEGELLDERCAVTTVHKLAEKEQTIAALDKIAEEKHTVSAIDKLAEGKPTFAAVDKIAEEKHTISTVDKLAKEKHTISAVDKLAEEKHTISAEDKLAEEKPAFEAVDKLAEEKHTISAVDKLAEEQPVFAAVNKLAEEKHTVSAVDKLAEEKPAFASVDKLAEEKHTLSAVDKLAAEKHAVPAVDKLAEDKPAFAAVDKLAEEKHTISAVDKLAEEKHTISAVDKLAEEKHAVSAIDKLAEEKHTISAVDKLAEEKPAFAAVDKLAEEKHSLSAIDKLAEEKHTVSAVDKLAAEKHAVPAVDKLSDEKHTVSALDKLAEERHTVSAVDKLAEERHTVSAVDKLTEERHTVSAVDKLADERHTVSAVDKLAAEIQTVSASDKYSEEKSTPVVQLTEEKTTVPAQGKLLEEETTATSVDKAGGKKHTVPAEKRSEEKRPPVAVEDKLAAEEPSVPTQERSAGDKIPVKTGEKSAEKRKLDQTGGSLAGKAAHSTEDKISEYKATGHAEEKLGKVTAEKLGAGKEIDRPELFRPLESTRPVEPSAAVSDDLIFQKSRSADRPEKVTPGGAVGDGDDHLPRSEITEEIETVSSVVRKDLGTGVETCETRQEIVEGQFPVSVSDTSVTQRDTAVVLNQEFVERSGDQKEKDPLSSGEATTEKQKKGKKGKKQGKGGDGKGDSLPKQDELSSGGTAKGNKTKTPVVAKSTEETQVKQQQQKKEKGTGKEKEKKTDEGNVSLEKGKEPPVNKSEVQTKPKKGKRSKKNKENELGIAEKGNDENGRPSEENSRLEAPQHKHDHTCLIKGHAEQHISGKKDSQLKATETTKAGNRTVTIEDLSDDESNDHESVGDEEEQKAADTGDQPTKASKSGDDILSPNVSRQRQSRSEKKARKALSKMGLKQVHGVTQITMKRTKNVMFTIENPDVFKNPGSETYIIFGEARIDDLEERSKSAAADKFRRTEAAEAAKVLQETKAEELVVSEQPESEEELEDGGVEPNDIELVMSQAGVSRNKAIKALRENKNDIVNAIMALTM